MNLLELRSIVFMNAAVPILVADRRGNIIDVNPEAERAYEWSRKELLGQPLERIAPPAQRRQLASHLARCRRGETLRNLEGIAWNKGGEQFPVLMSLSPLPDHEGAGAAVVVSMKRISELKRTQEELTGLAGRILSVEEEERRRIGRELHDSLGQQLAMLAMEAARLERACGSLPAAISQGLRGLRERIDKVSDDLHELARQLHPSMVVQLGLAPALKSLCEEFSRHRGMAVKCAVAAVPKALPHGVSLCLYRIVQEALLNVAKHAGATRVEVTVRGSGRGLLLRIRDFGKGFDAARETARRGLGLFTMEERAREVGGTFRVRSAPGQGTEVEVRVPSGES